LLNVTDLLAFQTFLRLCAGRTGQLLNLSSVGADAGITHNTARSWLSVLEASYLSFRLPPYFRNLGKRLLKTPKLHFHDSGLVCYLLGIRSPDELRHHPLRGAIFESWVLSEIVKAHVHSGATPDVTFFRDRHGLEVDAVVQAGRRTLLVEARSGETVPRERWTQHETTALPWADIDRYDWLPSAPSPARLRRAASPPLRGGEAIGRFAAGAISRPSAVRESPQFPASPHEVARPYPES
jgi:predicted AAA+ superfamily ATPase